MSNKKRWFTILLLAGLFLSPLLTVSQVEERFPKPDFQSGYTRPDLKTPMPRSPWMEVVDVAVLILVLSLASLFALKHRSRRRIFWLMIFSLAYFGFYRMGCVCSIGAIQNVSYAIFNSGYFIPLAVIGFFIIPLVFTLLFGRTFCAAACPLGAIQDAVVLYPVKVPGWLSKPLGLLPYLYLGFAVLFAATGAGFVICQYDPFVGFFRFGASFNMLILGISLLLLGTVIARPYCRFLCPYGVLLNWLSRISRRHVNITPDECNNCRLCEESCPFGAIKKPDQSEISESRGITVRRLAILILLLPVLAAATGWVVSRLYIPLSRSHFTVSLAEEIMLEDSGARTETTEETEAFRAAGKPTEQLLAEARLVQQRFKRGGWILGIFMGLVFGLTLIRLAIHRREPQYTIDRGACISCGRCFIYCPYEQVRLGIITPEELDEIDPGPATESSTE